MATPIAVAADVSGESNVVQTFLGLSTLEAQLTYLACLMESAEQTFNAANPQNTVNIVTVSPDFDDGEVTVTVINPLNNINATLVPLWESTSETYTGTDVVS